MTRIDNAVKKFHKGYACSQAILSEYCQLFKMQEETALKISSGFGGGMGQAETCGAVTAAYMVLGLGFAEKDCRKAVGRKKVQFEIGKFTEMFKEEHGSCSCKALLGCDISNPEGLKKAREEQLFQTICPKYVKTAAELLEKMLDL